MVVYLLSEVLIVMNDMQRQVIKDRSSGSDTYHLPWTNYNWCVGERLAGYRCELIVLRFGFMYSMKVTLVFV